MWKRELHHDGVVFPRPFDAKGLKLSCAGEKDPVALTPEAEEIALAWARFVMRDSKASSDPHVQQNFWQDFNDMLLESSSKPSAKKAKRKKKKLMKNIIIPSCNFDDIASAHQKKNAKSEEAAAGVVGKSIPPLAAPTFAIVDGKKFMVGNSRVTAPGIFVGRTTPVVARHSSPQQQWSSHHDDDGKRGDGRILVAETAVAIPPRIHEDTGRVRRRMYPEDVTLNLSPGARIPPSPIPGHSWGRVVHNRRARWIAKWQDTVTGKQNYVHLSVQSDAMEKFDVVRRLSEVFQDIVAKNLKTLRTHRRESVRQHAACVAIMCDLGIRVGKEGSTKIYGAATLLKEHVSLVTTAVTAAGGGDGGPDTFRISFVGKDGVPYIREDWRPPEELAQYLRNNITYTNTNNTNNTNNTTNTTITPLLSRQTLKKKRRLMSLVTPKSVNAYLSTLGKGLTSKVIRTIRANQEFLSALRMLSSPPEVDDKIIDKKDKKNKKNKKKDKVMIALSPKQRFKLALEHAAEFCNHKKFVKEEDNDKKNNKKKNKKKKRNGGKNQVKNHHLLSTSTTLNNYIDPRIVVQFAKDEKINPKSLFPKSLIVKYSWAFDDHDHDHDDHHDHDDGGDEKRNGEKRKAEEE
jgi:DNA topoisomerase-1